MSEFAMERALIMAKQLELPLDVGARRLQFGGKGTPAQSVKDMVTLPDHYARWKIEPIHFLGENQVDIFQFNIIKYVMRHKAKNGREDLAKAKRYLEMYIAKEYDQNPDWWKAPSP